MIKNYIHVNADLQKVSLIWKLDWKLLYSVSQSILSVMSLQQFLYDVPFFLD